MWITSGRTRANIEISKPSSCMHRRSIHFVLFFFLDPLLLCNWKYFVLCPRGFQVFQNLESRKSNLYGGDVYYPKRSEKFSFCAGRTGRQAPRSVSGGFRTRTRGKWALGSGPLHWLVLEPHYFFFHLAPFLFPNVIPDVAPPFLVLSILSPTHTRTPAHPQTHQSKSTSRTAT